VTILYKYKYLICIIGLLMIATFVKASTYVDVGDDVYDVLHRLEAEGVIQSGLLTTKPLSRKEIIRLIQEAERNSEDRSDFIRRQIEWLKKEFRADLDGAKHIKPLDKVTTTYIHADDEPSELSFNNDGDDYDNGSNFRLGFSSRAELGWLSLYVNPEIRYSDSDTDLELIKAYGVLSFWGMELEVGKDSQWWGPGYHGTILMTNNPEPLTMIKLTNSRPLTLPWIFEPLGLFKFTTFVTRLEEDRVVSEPLLWGLRLNLKPNPYIEIGLQRTAIFGGEGYSEGLSTWWDVIRGEGEDDPNVPGDQRAGFDMTLTLPFESQPFQIYFEADGEDEAGGLPTKWAYLMGLYLPRVASFEQIGFRAEYISNHVSDEPNVWYNHDIYQTGYTYEGRIIGHHMDTDSKDLFLEVSYLIPEVNGKLSIAYDMMEHNLSGNVNEKKQEIYMKADMDLTESLRINAAYGYGKIKDIDNYPGNDENISTFLVKLSYYF